MNANAIGSAVVAHLDSAYNLAYWLIANEHDAQDVVQEALMRAVKSESACRSGDARAWVLATVRNACFDWLRRKKISPLEELGDLDPVGVAERADPVRILQRAEDVNAVRNAIARLPPGIREVIVLRELEDMSYREIAAVTATPIGTVMSRLARGRARLAEILSTEKGRPT